ncbi:MAG: sodium:proton antiporter [Nitrospirae bacterium]|nr:sodium:proton antiporter [Nitrospirota bacterium]
MESPGTLAALHVLGISAIILAIGILSSKLAGWIKVPDVVVLLLAGVFVGPPGLNWVDVPVEGSINQIILIFGASYILFEGGSSLSLKVIKKVWLTITLLAIPGVLITAAVAGIAAYWIIGMPLVPAFLLAAVIASTDPATLVPVFKQIKIKERVAQTVISESAFNDATGAILTFTILGLATTGQASLGKSLINFFQMAGGGILAGMFFGFAAAFVIAHTRYRFLMEYAPLVTVIAVVSAYLIADKFGTSGFMAVFVVGMIIGNLDAYVIGSILGNPEPHRFKMDQEHAHLTHHFIGLVATISRMFIFIFLGTHVNLSLLQKYLWSGIAVVTIFMLIARPLAVLCCTLPDRKAQWQWREIIFMFWTRETGVIPAALSGILIGTGVAYADVIASITFMAVLSTILIQASSTKWVARKLDLLEE